MIPLKLVMTTAGLGRFTAAQTDNGVDLTVTEVGFSAANFVAAPTLTALPGEFRRVSTVSGETAGPNLVHMTVQDDTPDTYTVRGFGLFLGDGTLFATYSQPQVIAEKSSNAMLALVIDIAFPDAGVENITFGSTDFLNPPATAERKGVVELATLAEAKAGDPDRVTTGEIVKAMLTDALPIGTITLWFGAVAPAGWAICDGSEVEKADGTGTITLPDLRGRAAVGASGDHGLGLAFGESIRSIDTRMAGGHNHDVSVFVSRSSTEAAVNTTSRNVDAGGSAGGVLTSATLADPGHSHSTDVTVSAAGSHAHAVEIDVTQPSLALHYIMRL
jgi:microcystin-dependent protein